MEEEFKTQEDNSIDERYFTLFSPKKNMLTEYPELSEVDEFKGLSNNQLRFVWFSANKTSPVYIENFDDSKNAAKLRYAIDKTIGPELNASDYKNMISGIIPHELKAACHKMRSYRFSDRLRAKVMVETIFSKYEEIIGMNVTKDTESHSSYVATTSKIIDKLPELIKLQENAFGIVQKSKSDTKKVNLMDILHDRE